MSGNGAPAAGNAGSPDLARNEEKLARAKSRSVFIATPIARHPTRQYTSSLVKTVGLLARLGIPMWMGNTVGNSNLPRARNELVAAFLASGTTADRQYTDMLFIDDDMGWNAHDVVRLLASPQDVIGGVGCKKTGKPMPDTDPTKWCFRGLGEEVNQDEDGNVEVETVGTGFLKITRAPFLSMIEAHPDWKRRGWPSLHDEQRRWYYQFFKFDSLTPDEWGEDTGWCRAHRALGGTVWIDPTIRLIHVGEAEYTGNIEALFT